MQAERFDRHDVVAVQRDQTVRRADELLVAEVVAGARVAHDLGDRQLRDRLVERVLQRRAQRDRHRRLQIEQALHLPVLPALDPIGGHERETLESGLRLDRLLEGLGGRSVRVERHGDRQQLE